MKDPCLDELIKAKDKQSHGRDFIGDRSMFPEPVVFLTTEEQQFDIERLCTNPESLSIMGVDALFQIPNLNYYFTFVTYKNLLFETKRVVTIIDYYCNYYTFCSLTS